MNQGIFFLNTQSVGLYCKSLHSFPCVPALLPNSLPDRNCSTLGPCQAVAEGFLLLQAFNGPFGLRLLVSADIEQVNAFKWMGVVMIAVALVGVGGQYFPMWGGMFFPARKGYTEEDYYFAEYSVAERERGLHLASSAFVSILHLFCVLLLSDALGFMLPHVCCFPTKNGVPEQNH